MTRRHRIRMCPHMKDVERAIDAAGEYPREVITASTYGYGPKCEHCHLERSLDDVGLCRECRRVLGVR